MLTLAFSSGVHPSARPSRRSTSPSSNAIKPNKLHNHPHVLFTIIDDLGWNDVGFRSRDINTPAMDSLARQGLVLEHHYVDPTCSPSRSTFLTGRYAMHHGVVDWLPPQSPVGLPVRETTMADTFHSAGYVTAAVGKWHVGFHSWESTPTFRGFDSFYGFYGGGEDYFDHKSQDKYDFRRDSSRRCGASCSEVHDVRGKYSTTLFAKEAVRVVHAHARTKPSTPLFLYLAFQGVHGPPQVPPEYKQPYQDTISDGMRRTFAGMLTCVDKGIQNVTSALDDTGMLTSTLIVVTSDNGGPTTTSDAVGARNWPLRGGKHSLWNGGVRATALIAGAGIQRQGGLFPHLFHGSDWLPTLAAAAQIPLISKLALDGVSHWEALSSPLADDGNTNWPAATRSFVVLGNSTNNCHWSVENPPKTGCSIYDPQCDNSNFLFREPTRLSSAIRVDSNVSCGFAVLLANETTSSIWKLIRGYGGGPDTWCNSTDASEACDNSISLPTNAAHSTSQCTGQSDGHCLYELLSDPAERSELTAVPGDYDGILANLKGLMDEALSSYSEQKIDPTCGNATFLDHDQMGLVWQPWCTNSDAPLASKSRHAVPKRTGRPHHGVGWRRGRP